MAKTKLEKAADIDAEILQLTNQKKRLLQQHREEERKARTRRLIERGAIVESMVVDASNMTNDEFKAYIELRLIQPPVSQQPQQLQIQLQDDGANAPKTEGGNTVKMG